jgi:Amt family ammonium transporter
MRVTVLLQVVCGGAVLAATALPASAWAASGKIDNADTAWMLVATGFVLMMSIPGLALFYSGMVRRKNVLSTMGQSFVAVALGSIVWMAFGYDLAFTGNGAFIGEVKGLFLSGIGINSISAFATTIPEILFMAYQMTFAVITIAIIAGAVAERMSFSAFLWFSALWLIFVYVPIAHWVWGGGFLSSAGLLDFAGGTVVHITAGVAGLVAAFVLGRRLGYGKSNFAPYDISMAVTGAGLLWVGWFGFNGGSAYAADSRAAMAIVATHLAASAGALTWGAIEWRVRGKPTVLGVISGAIAGLATITPASGYVLPWHGAVIGVIAGAICFFTATELKRMLGYDDSLDVFGIHGISGILGTFLTGVFATASMSIGANAPNGYPGLLEGNPGQIIPQLYGIAVTIVWCGAVTFILLKLVGVFVPLRVSAQSEGEGLDLAEHYESIQATEADSFARTSARGGPQDVRKPELHAAE